MSLGQLIHAARSECSFSVAELARKVNVTEKAVWLWEADERHPRFENVVAIAEATGFPLDYFAGKETQGETAADTAVHR